MIDSETQTELVGVRQLMNHTGKAKATVRGWFEKTTNPLPYTLNEDGYKVFQIAQVDEWLVARLDAHEKAEPATSEVTEAIAIEKLRSLQLDNDEKEFRKHQRDGTWGHKEEYRPVFRAQYLKIKKYISKYVDSQKKRNRDLAPSEAEEFDRRFIDFCNRLADLSPIEHEESEPELEVIYPAAMVLEVERGMLSPEDGGIAAATAEERLRALQLDNDEREHKRKERSKDWDPRDNFAEGYRKRIIQIRPVIIEFIESEKQYAPSLSESDSSEIDRHAAEFFDSIAELSQLQGAPAYHTLETSH